MKDQQPNFDLKEAVRAYWSARAATFDNSPSHYIEARYGRPEWQAFIKQAAGLSQGDTMAGFHTLDLACGTGEISRVLLSLGAEVIGVDFSEAMLAKSSAKLAKLNWKPRLCDAEVLSGISTESVDFIVTRHLVWTLTDPANAFLAWYRALKPGGRLLINDGNWSKPFSVGYRIRRKIADWLKPRPGRSSNDLETDAYIRQNLPYKDGLCKQRLTSELEMVGFTLLKELDTSPLYRQAMRAWPLADRLRQSSEHRFALVFAK